MIIQLRKKQVLRLISLILICAMLLFTATAQPAHSPIMSTQGDIASNNNHIDELKQRADRFAKENQDREVQMRSLRGDQSKLDEFIRIAEEQIAAVQRQIGAYIELIDAQTQSIEENEREILRKELAIINTQTRIADRISEIERLDGENTENIEKFGQLAAQMYMNSGNDMISLLTGSTSFYDILVRTEMIRNIGEKNIEFMQSILNAIDRQQVLIGELETEQAFLREEERELREQREQLEREMAELQELKDEVEKEVDRQYGILMELTSERADLQDKVRGLQGEYESANRSIGSIALEIAELEAANRRIEEAILREQDPNRTVYSDAFIWPLENRFKYISCTFGCRCYTPPRLGPHNGVDVGNSGINGANIFAMRSGTVTEAGWNGCCHRGYGLIVRIDHGGGYSTLYSHMLAGSLAVSKGQDVVQGQIIGRVGSTGLSTGAHLHFEVRIDGRTVDPMKYFPNFPTTP
jgi:murein DD-endopeptidase MepM/ murein hydrolase activator NlpD